jgi:hypothetical protein
MEQVVIVDPDKALKIPGSCGLARGPTTYRHSPCRGRRSRPVPSRTSDRVFVVEAEKPVIDALRALPGVKTPAQLDPASTHGFLGLHDEDAI